MSERFIPDLYMQSIMPNNYLSGTLNIPLDVARGSNGCNYSSSMESIKSVFDSLPKPDPMGLNGGIVVSSYLCESPSFIRWKRNHRKSRINKKWHKRYGAVYSACKGVAFNVMGTLTVCPCMQRLMIDTAAKRRREMK